MASSHFLKKLFSSTLIPNALRPTRPLASAFPLSYSRLFNSKTDEDSDGFDEDGLDEDGRRYRRSIKDFLSSVPKPWRYLVRFHMEAQRKFPPIGYSQYRGGFRHDFAARVTEDAVEIRIDLPGVGKEDVNVSVSVEHNTLEIKGERAKDSTDDEEEEKGIKFGCKIDLIEKIYKTSDVKAEMENGVLKLVVPKLKGEERDGVFQVKID